MATPQLFCQHPTDLPRHEYDLYYEALFCELPAYDSMRDDEMTPKKKTRKSFVSLI
jgi:hypothetical protein